MSKDRVGSKDQSARGKEDEHTDDMSTGLHLQQFLDEWYYRCLHSGLANDWDRERCAVAALDLFELQGVVVKNDEKPYLAAMNDDDMIEAVVRRMPDDARKAFEHFALQLQLVMSAASRVRCALEEGPPEEVARIMEEGDQGVNSQILKQTIIEATVEVGELRGIHDDWDYSMGKRVNRLGQCQRETDRGRMELEKLKYRLGVFGNEQNAKSERVLLGMVANGEKSLMQTVFKVWWTWKVKFMTEKSIHDKFRKEIDDAERKLMEYKQAQIQNVRAVLKRNSDGAIKLLLTECVRVWAKEVQDEKEEKGLRGHMELARNKMSGLKAAQKDNAKASMMRIVAGNEESIKNVCFQGWTQFHEEVKKTKEFEVLVKAQEEKMQDFMKKKSEEARGVLSKMAGSSDTGSMHTAFQAWVDDWKSICKAREMEDMMNGHNAKLASLNARVKGNASSTAQRANELETENTLMCIFMNWATEAKLGRLIRHYSGHLDTKKQQLEAVQTMFKSFAQQLEHGISTTPRTTRKSNRSSSRADKSDGQAKPPQMPAGAAS